MTSPDMNDLIKEIHAEWLEAKARAAALCRRAGNYEVADKIDACDIFTGDETLPEIIDKMFSPQGREFITSFGFPDIETFRRFIPYHPEQYGVFIDTQKIALTDVSRVYLIGNTSGRLNYEETQGNTVVLMHGASADITAAGYSVVKVELGAQCRYHADKRDHAIVM